MILNFEQLKQLVRKRGGTTAALQNETKRLNAARAMRERPARRPSVKVRLLESRQTTIGKIVIPAGAVGRVLGSYDGGLFATFGAELVRLPEGAGYWEVVK